MKQADPFIPKKSLGQNFLINPKITERILSSCNLKSTDIVLEIGPGQGALTYALSARCKNVIAIEKDTKLSKKLKHDFEKTNVTVINADILKYPFHKFPENTKIIGNLPYHIAAPIIKKIIDNHKKFPEIYITVQLEFGQRIIAKPNNKNYGSFSCYVQYYADVDLLFKIKNSSFRPIPKVQSCFLRLTFPKKPKYKVKDENLLFHIIHSCFGQRRKTIGNSLACAMEKGRVFEVLQMLQMNPRLRAENLSLEEYIRIANTVEKLGKLSKPECTAQDNEIRNRPNL